MERARELGWAAPADPILRQFGLIESFTVSRRILCTGGIVTAVALFPAFFPPPAYPTWVMRRAGTMASA